MESTEQGRSSTLGGRGILIRKHAAVCQAMHERAWLALIYVGHAGQLSRAPVKNTSTFFGQAGGDRSKCLDGVSDLEIPDGRIELVPLHNVMWTHNYGSTSSDRGL